MVYAKLSVASGGAGTLAAPYALADAVSNTVANEEITLVNETHAISSTYTFPNASRTWKAQSNGGVVIDAIAMLAVGTVRLDFPIDGESCIIDGLKTVNFKYDGGAAIALISHSTLNGGSLTYRRCIFSGLENKTTGIRASWFKVPSGSANADFAFDRCSFAGYVYNGAGSGLLNSDNGTAPTGDSFTVTGCTFYLGSEHQTVGNNSTNRLVPSMTGVSESISGSLFVCESSEGNIAVAIANGNTVYNCTITVDTAVTVLVSDPLLADPVNGNFELLPNSPAIPSSNGVPTDAIWVDLTGAGSPDGTEDLPYDWVSDRAAIQTAASLTESKSIAFVDGLTYILTATALDDDYTFYSQTNKGATVSVETNNGVSQPSVARTINFKGLVFNHTEELVLNNIQTPLYTFNFISCKHNCLGGDVNYDSAVINNIGCEIVLGVKAPFHRGVNGTDLGCTLVSGTLSVGYYWFSNAVVTRTLKDCVFISTDPAEVLNNTNTLIVDGGGNSRQGFASSTIAVTWVNVDNLLIADVSNNNFELLPNSPAIPSSSNAIVADYWFAPTAQGGDDGLTREDAKAFSQSNLDAAYGVIGNNDTIAFRGDLGEYTLVEDIIWNNDTTERSGTTHIGENGTVFNGDATYNHNYRLNYINPALFQGIEFFNGGGLAVQEAAFNIRTNDATPSIIAFKYCGFRDLGLVNANPAVGHALNGAGNNNSYSLDSCHFSDSVFNNTPFLYVSTTTVINFVRNCSFYANADSGGATSDLFVASSGETLTLDKCIVDTAKTIQYRGGGTMVFNGGVIPKSKFTDLPSFDGNELDAAPLFADPANGNFELLPNSPALN